MSTDHKALMENLLKSNLDQAIWALRRFVGDDAYITVIAGALAELNITAARLAIYSVVGDRMDVDLLALTSTVGDRIREASNAIQQAGSAADEALPGVPLSQDDPGRSDILPAASCHDPAAAAAPG